MDALLSIYLTSGNLITITDNKLWENTMQNTFPKYVELDGLDTLCANQQITILARHYFLTLKEREKW